MRPYNVRRVVSKKLLKNLNVKYKTETFTKNDLILIEGSSLNTKMLEKLFFILIFSTIDILICSINNTNDSIILLGKIVKSTSDSYQSLVCKITAFSAMKIIYILMIEIVLNVCITLLEKCNYRPGYFVFQITATHTFCLHPKVFCCVDKMYEIKRSFVKLLKSMSFYETFCIFLRIPIFSIRIKYYKLRFQPSPKFFLT